MQIVSISQISFQIMKMLYGIEILKIWKLIFKDILRKLMYLLNIGEIEFQFWNIIWMQACTFSKTLECFSKNAESVEIQKQVLELCILETLNSESYA